MKIKELKHAIEFGFVKIFFIILPLFSIEFLSKLGDFLGKLVFYLIPYRRAVTLDNLRKAFPEKAESEIKAIARRCYQNFGRTFLQFFALQKMSAEDIRYYVDFSECYYLLKQVEAQGKGGIILTAHFGNWEWLSVAMGAYGFKGCGVTRTQKNRKVNELMKTLREKTGIRTASIKNAPREIFAALKNNEFVGIVADQDFKKKGSVWVNFFGRPVLIAQGPAVFALRTNATIVYSFTYHQPDGRLKVKILPLPAFEPGDDHEENVQRFTQLHTTLLEQVAREQPDHWFWMHRRWKSTEKKGIVSSTE